MWMEVATTAVAIEAVKKQISCLVGGECGGGIWSELLMKNVIDEEVGG